MKFHFHEWIDIKTKYKPASNPRFEIEYKVQECLHCPKQRDAPTYNVIYHKNKEEGKNEDKSQTPTR